MTLEYKDIEREYNFLIIDDVGECMHYEVKEKVLEKLSLIKETRRNNERFFKFLDQEYKPEEITFNFHLSSYGGTVYDGLAMCDMLSRLDNEDNGITVNLFCEGKVMSMGLPICLSVRNRYASKNTTFMFHDISTFSVGKLENIKEDIKESERLQKIVMNIITKNSKITQSELKSWNKKKSDKFMSAQEALDKEIIKAII
ncbi:MAG: ATP-dependent Clp protease proteolytic subunit [Erysipelotrichales bacterium]|nr:ATP-dependent Clp protease proteolytic subunit [Erysipelotrichales bacterium]